MSSGWGNGYLKGSIRDADNPPEAPKLSSIDESIRERLSKRRLGKEQPKFICQNCQTTDAVTQLECLHIICAICNMNFKGCPLCSTG